MRNRLVGASVLAMVVAQAGMQAHAQTANATAGAKGTIEEVVVTAQKRSEKLQRVPESIQVLDTKTLSQLHVTEFTDYIKYIPSLQTQTTAPDQTTLYLRGVSDGGNANHSGPLPVVGTYLDEMPTSTIGGTLDVHLYDIARVEVLPGPQGTLYGASSEAGTVRFITNAPNPNKFEAGYSISGNSLPNQGSFGGTAEGFVNIPITDKIAVRLVAFDEHDAGYINNDFATRTYPTAAALYGNQAATINNAKFADKNFNPNDSFGGRAALRVDLNEDWTITPEVVAQDLRNNGVFGFEPSVGDLQVERFQPDTWHDRWVQAAMNVTGHIEGYTLNYAGGFFVRDVHSQSDYSDYSIFYDAHNHSGAYWTGNDGNPLKNPSQEIVGRDHFNKESNEFRISSPNDWPVTFIAGVFQEVQNHHIVQDYQIQDLGADITVPGNWKNTLWLTDQLRTDQDVAAFTEATWHVTDKFDILAGVRPYYYDNSNEGFFGFSSGFSSHTGVAACKYPASFQGPPCEDLKADTTGSGETHKVNLTYRLTPDELIYFTYSTGYRPGGINRRTGQGNYQSDTLTNFEIGIKSTLLDHRLVWNNALYYEDWNQFQFAFLGANSFTIVKNAPSANIKGIESALEYKPIPPVTLTGGLTLVNAALSEDFCTDGNGNVLKTCTGSNVNPSSLASAGNALPYTPSAKGYLTARYNFPFYDWNGYVQSDLAFQTETASALRNEDKYYLGDMPSFYTLGLSAGVSKNNLNFDIFAKNLTDQRGELNRYTPCTIDVCANPVKGIPTAVYVVPIQPLTVGFRISQKF